MMGTTRRGFIGGCSAAIAALAGARLTSAAFADPGKMSENDEILIHVLLCGGMDGLNLVPPIGGADRGFYEAARPEVQIDASGPNRALPLGGIFGLHPSAAPLHDLYQDGKLAVIHAVGMDVANRSHFDSMRFIELGTPGTVTRAHDGWLTRHLSSARNLPSEIILPGISAGRVRARGLVGCTECLAMVDPGDFSLNTGPYRWRPAQRLALRRLLSRGNTPLHSSSLQALDALDIVELNTSGSYQPANGAVYPNTGFGDRLQTLAEMIKLDLGLRVASVELGGWDTHESQSGRFSSLVDQLSRALAAFYTDMDGSGSQNYAGRMTIVVQSEFGRRLRENADAGTDHGHGNVMMVLSGKANGGQVYTNWPGLANEQLFDGADLAVTTDYRQVLAEVLIRRLRNNRLGEVFPGLNEYTPLGILRGTDIDPVFGTDIFLDGFESGSTARWDSVYV